MPGWLDQLQATLEERSTACALRSLTTTDRCAMHVKLGGRELINLASNDYLGLATHPALAEAVSRAARESGVGSGSSRLMAGHTSAHESLERRFAFFMRAEGALLTPTGYLANLSTLTALSGEEDVVLLDKLCHASLIDAARLSGATVRTFPHKNLDRLSHLLERYAEARRRFIVTDTVFSMDGDCADLPALCALRDRHDAILIVDEAHAVGVLGEKGEGLACEQGVLGKIDVTISTMGKAFGSFGGIVTGPQAVIDTLVNCARPFIFATASPPTQVAAIDAALDLIKSEPSRRQKLRELSSCLRSALRAKGWPVTPDLTPIVPLIVGENEAALELSRGLEAAGFLVPAIRPPTVAPGSARVRISLRCDLEPSDLDRLVTAIGEPPL